MVAAPVLPELTAKAILEKWQWLVMALMGTLLLSISGAVLMSYQARVAGLETLVRGQGERLAVVESQSQEVNRRLVHIEEKLDRLLELKIKP